MELENQNTRNAYIQLLEDTLIKKTGVLNKLVELTGRQEDMISHDDVNEEDFLQLISLKDEQIQTLNKLDAGFEQLYESVKNELIASKGKYIQQIQRMQEIITTITDLSVKLQTMERRNKSRFEVFFSAKRNNIRQARISNRTAANYYKSMSKQDTGSIFYDKKK